MSFNPLTAATVRALRLVDEAAGGVESAEVEGRVGRVPEAALRVLAGQQALRRRAHEDRADEVS